MTAEEPQAPSVDFGPPNANSGSQQQPPRSTKIKWNLYCVQVGFCILVSWVVFFNIAMFSYYGLSAGTGKIAEEGQVSQDPVAPEVLLNHVLASLDDLNLFIYDLELLKAIQSDDIPFSMSEYLLGRRGVRLGTFFDQLNCGAVLGYLEGWLCGDQHPNIWLQPLPGWTTEQFSVHVFKFNATKLSSSPVHHTVVQLAPDYSYIYNDWSTRPCLVANMQMRCPDLASMQQVEEGESGAETNRFVGCDPLRVAKFYEDHPQQLTLSEARETKDFRRGVRHILSAASRALDSLNIPFWISSSVALGWYRQCDVIPYSQDADIGIWASDYRPELITALEQEGLELKLRLGRPDSGFQLAFYSKNIKLDVYFFYPSTSDTESVWNGATNPENGARYKYVFPKFQTCWTFFLDLKIRAPCPSEAYLEANYGHKLMEPITDWSWSTSPPNVQPWGEWPENERDEAVQVFELAAERSEL